MPGGYHRGGGSDRGRKRPPMHSIHGGHVVRNLLGDLLEMK